MALTVFAATAATCEIVLGTEQPIADGTLKIQGRVFTDRVESQDSRIAGTNVPTLDITINPKSGDGDLQGKFRLKPNTVDGAWEGELQGRFVNGLVTSWGIARGSGALLGSVLRIDFQQVVEYPGKPPCEDPKAFFEMRGLILEQD
ncbi:MAG: hypothetical protein A2Z45_11855 [Chloroflexi bacterium RBG_19FT_COMBO_55_16]|nr:MAG: hypothetical protein A2Z45_11855 [Chloroflexi bacterium RBG_19FT_COMBO_55_16]